MDVWRVVEGQKVQCGVAGTLECERGVGGGPAWQTSVVWTPAGRMDTCSLSMQVIGCPNAEI